MHTKIGGASAADMELQIQWSQNGWDAQTLNAEVCDQPIASLSSAASMTEKAHPLAQ